MFDKAVDSVLAAGEDIGEDPGIEKLAKIFADLLKKNLDREFGGGGFKIGAPQIEVKVSNFGGKEYARIVITTDVNAVKFLKSNMNGTPFFLIEPTYATMLGYIQNSGQPIDVSWRYELKVGGWDGWRTVQFKFQH